VQEKQEVLSLGFKTPAKNLFWFCFQNAENFSIVFSAGSRLSDYDNRYQNK